MVEVKELKVEHVLMFVITAFLLYHLIGNCGCANRGDGFSVGNMMYQGIVSNDISGLNQCAEHIREGDQQCEYNFYRIDKNSHSGIYKCMTEGNTCSSKSDVICNGTNCPTCNAFLLKNMELKSSKDQIIKKPLNCNNIQIADTCETKYINLWNSNASNIEWNNGSFTNGNYVKGDLSWTTTDNTIRNIRDICFSEQNAMILSQDLIDRCSQSIQKNIVNIENVDKKSSDVDIIQEIKKMIKDENIEYGIECCGHTGKCSASQLSKLQETYLKTIAKNKYCEKETCNEQKKSCIGVYNASANNGSGSLSAKCGTCIPSTKLLEDDSCGDVTCNPNIRVRGLASKDKCIKGEICTYIPAGGLFPGEGSLECVKH